MGVVYEAIDVERGERIALKTILHHDADTVARVKHEFRALQDIHHRNLVTLRELVAESDDVFFTMELVDGVDLLTWVRGRERRAPTTNSPTILEVSALDSTDTRPRSRLGQAPSGEATRAASRDADATDTDIDVDLYAIPAASGPQPTAGRERGSFDEARLRDAFGQIALGLSALHGAGKVHRDVKPSNVRVTHDGRVVLLDFGLVFDVSGNVTADGNVVGTPSYMAPEQAFGGPVGPEADWYAVGVVLYECLTGRRPFEGDAARVLVAKRYQDPLPPSALVDGIPQDLEELCLALLEPERRGRPSGDEVLKRLQARTSDRPATGGAPFVGRDAELDALEGAFDEVVGGRAVTVALHGESGVGKSCLVRRFLDVTLAGRDDVLVLAGRCYEREAVPYKALDEVIETLSRRLANMPRDQAARLLPADLASLALLFPAMARVSSRASRPSAHDRDPLERRRAAFRTLRELFARLAEARRVVVTIDDLQWTDADSLALLHEVLRGPDAPPLLLVVTLRETPGDVAKAHAPASPLDALPGTVHRVPIGRLAAEDARRLAEDLLVLAANAPGEAAAIAAEAGGHPLFIDELVRHASLAARTGEGALRLDDALWRRVQHLDEAARGVLEVACVLGAPASQEAVANAAGIDMGELARAVSLLRATNFVRTGGARATDTIEPFHDRVREAVVARLDAEARRDCHGRIAAALELTKGADPEVLSTHWAGADEPAKAARHALVAADQAAQALAFHRAARLCERALALMPEQDARRRAVQAQLGDALANAGASERAAAAYESAAEGAGPAEALDLKRRAADQLLRAGEVERGLAAARAVLEAVGIALPTTTLGALLSFLWYRLLLWLRGTRVVHRAPGEVDPTVRTRIDVLWSVAFTLPYADPLASAICHTQHVLLGLSAGDPMRAARALAMEAGYVASSGFVAGWPRAEKLLAAARAEAARTEDPYAHAIVLGIEGIACCASMHFERSVEKCKAAVSAFQLHCPGSAYEIATAHFYLFVSLAYGTLYGRLRPMLERALEDAAARGDRFAAGTLRLGILNSTWLFAGDPARARREIAEAKRAWPGDGRFRVVDYQSLVAECWADLYEGEYARARAALEAKIPALRRSLLLVLQAYRCEIAALRARLALACAAAEQGSKRSALLREAERMTRDLSKMRDPLRRVNLRLIRANAAALRGRVDEGLAIVEQMAGDDGAEAWLSRQCARLLLARMRDDARMQRLAEDELAAAGGVADPRITRLYFPAFHPAPKSQA
jgi:serine/threonine protein kinase